jgi:hypothetical protein
LSLFFTTNVTIISSDSIAVIQVKFFSKLFGENIFKVITLPPLAMNQNSEEIFVSVYVGERSTRSGKKQKAFRVCDGHAVANQN